MTDAGSLRAVCYGGRGHGLTSAARHSHARVSADARRHRVALAQAFRALPGVPGGRSRRYLFHERRCSVLCPLRRLRHGLCQSALTENPINYFDIDGARPFANDADRELVVADFGRLLERIEGEWRRLHGEALSRTLLMGRYLKGFRELPVAQRIGLDFPEIDATTFSELVLESRIAVAAPHLNRKPLVVILHELLEACRDPGAVLRAF